jgi:VanZ family protein
LTRFQKIYKFVFWFGYLAVLVTSFIPITAKLNEIKVGHGFFEIRLDHLLHLSVYFLICMYYWAGQRQKIELFGKKPLLKFILVILFLATFTEFVQLWVPERAFNIMDWVANVSGIGLGIVIIVAAGRK